MHTENTRSVFYALKDCLMFQKEMRTGEFDFKIF